MGLDDPFHPPKVRESIPEPGAWQLESGRVRPSHRLALADGSRGLSGSVRL